MSNYAAVADDSQLVISRSKQYADAIVEKDADNLEILLSDSYTHQSFGIPDGNKAGTIAYFTHEQRSFTAYNLNNVRVRIDGDVAIETGEIGTSMTESGIKHIWSGQRYTRIWLKRNGEWRLSHEHLG